MANVNVITYQLASNYAVTTYIHALSQYPEPTFLNINLIKCLYTKENNRKLSYKQVYVDIILPQYKGYISEMIRKVTNTND